MKLKCGSKKYGSVLGIRTKNIINITRNTVENNITTGSTTSVNHNTDKRTYGYRYVCTEK